MHNCTFCLVKANFFMEHPVSRLMSTYFRTHICGAICDCEFYGNPVRIGLRWNVIIVNIPCPNVCGKNVKKFIFNIQALNGKQSYYDSSYKASSTLKTHCCFVKLPLS